MYDDLIDSSDLPIARKSILPGTGFFVPDDLEEDLTEAAIEAALDGATAVVVADGDADGLACVALIREAFDDVLVEPAHDDDDDDDVPDDPDERTEGTADDGVAVPLEDVPTPTPHRVALVPTGPHDLPQTLEHVNHLAEDGLNVYVCDIAPDDFERVRGPVTGLTDRADAFRWFDHHQWDESVEVAVREAGVDLVIGDSDEECTADVALRSIDHDFEERWADLVAATRDHDLWIREDPRSDDLADFAYWSDPETYVETIRANGADLSPAVDTFLEDRRVEKRALIEQAVGRAEYRDVGPWTVGVTYGRCSQNEVAEAMRERGADASVIVKPAGSASIRGSEGFERCHEVAQQVDGGGHPRAAGCKPDIYDDMLDYAHHWTTRGAVAKQVILNAFLSLVDEDDEGGAAAGTN